MDGCVCCHLPSHLFVTPVGTFRYRFGWGAISAGGAHRQEEKINKSTHGALVFLLYYSSSAVLHSAFSGDFLPLRFRVRRRARRLGRPFFRLSNFRVELCHHIILHEKYFLILLCVCVCAVRVHNQKPEVSSLLLYRNEVLRVTVCLRRLAREILLFSHQSLGKGVRQVVVQYGRKKKHFSPRFEIAT